MDNNKPISLNLKEDLQEEAKIIRENEKQERMKYLQEKFNKLEKKGGLILDKKNLNKKRERAGEEN
jgi:hypothetical protein